MSTEEEAKAGQRLEIEQRRYLFQKHPDGRWYKNQHGTVLTPVWVPCSSFEVGLLEGENAP